MEGDKGINQSLAHGKSLVFYDLQTNIHSKDIPRLESKNYKLRLTDENERLMIFEKSVIWMTVDAITRKLIFQTPIIDCFFTTFNAERENASLRPDQEKKELKKVLVVVLEDQIRVYDKRGTSSVISFPIHIKKAFPFQNGVIISKKPDSSLSQLDPNQSINNVFRLPIVSPGDNQSFPQSPQIHMSSTPNFTSIASSNLTSGSFSTTNSLASHESNFLTLLDPFGDLGLIVSSSTTSFSSKEELTSFPLSSLCSLSTTYNPIEKTITIYHTRYLSRGRSSKSKSMSYHGIRKNSKRNTSSSTSMMVTSSTSKMFDDDAKQIRSSSNPLSFDRMASGSEFNTDSSNHNSSAYTNNGIDSWNLKKDVIFTKLNSFSFKSDLKFLKVFNVQYVNQEALVICNLEIKSIEIFIFEKSPGQVALPGFKSSYTIDGIDAVLFNQTGKHSEYIAILKDNNHMVLCNVFYGIFSPIIYLVPRFPPVISLNGVFNSEVSFLCNDGENYTISLQTKPKDKFVSTLIESLRYLSHDIIYEFFWLHWCGNMSLGIPKNDDWKLYIVTLLSMSFPDTVSFDDVNLDLNDITQMLPFVKKAREASVNYPASLSIHSDVSLESLLPKIVLSLHTIREDLKLNIFADHNFKKLSLLLAQLVSWIGWPDNWFKYYTIPPSQIDRQIKVPTAEYIPSPPNVLESLSSLFTESLVPYMTFSIVAGEYDSVDNVITPRTYNILRLFEVLVSSEFEMIDLIKTMVSFGITTSEVESYPPGIFLVFKNSIVFCQKTVKSCKRLGYEDLKLIGRKDLLEFEKPASTHMHFLSQKNTPLIDLNPKDMATIIKPIFSSEVLTAWDDQAEADKFHVTRLIFSRDRRFYELTKLLQTSRVQIVNLDIPESVNDSAKLERQRAVAVRIALRRLTTPIGRGAVFNSSRKPLSTEGFPIPKMNFNTLILPDNINISLEPDSIDIYLMDWGYFHNGASSGLTVSKDFREISGSWVVFNKPPSLNAQHAGFLLGLGLNGHLKKLEEWHIYNYLGPKHNYTSVGLLIGMSASLRGTMDIKLTKVLSIHVVALLPPGSTNLNVQLPVQTAGIIGIGLLYLETQHRRMTEMLLSQISSILVINDKNVVNEGYQLAAGIALGYVNLGKGEQMKYTHDNHVVDELFSMATIIKDVQTSKEFDKSCSGAIIALIFIFMKTDNFEIADKLDIPKTTQLLDYIRPDLLMLRCFGKNIIMWDHIVASKEFVESEIPECVKFNYSIDSIDCLESDFLPYLNIACGILLSIAIKFASTGNLEAKNTLMYFFDTLMNIGSLEPSNYDEKRALIGARNVRDVVILGLSIIMAGTGDLDIMRRLRFLQDLTDDFTNYGNYMAINTALGFLFLGGGQQAFRTDDNFSIAALITSVYPIYGTNNYDCISECVEIHLQALRHFWALGVENRCLVVRDIENGQPIKLNVEVILRDKEKLDMTSPCLLPELSLIHKINTKSGYISSESYGEEDEHSGGDIFLPVEFDLIYSRNKQIEIFKKNLNFFVYKWKKYLNLNLSFEEMVEMKEGFDKFNEKADNGINCLKNLKVFNGLQNFEKDLLFDNISHDTKKISESSIIDFKLEVSKLVNDNNMNNVEKMWNLKLIFNFVDKAFVLRYEEKAMSEKKKKLEAMQSGFVEDSGVLFDESIQDEDFEDVSELNYLSVEFVEMLKNDLLSKITDLS